MPVVGLVQCDSPPITPHQGAIADDQGRGACSVGHVRPLSGKLELLSLDEWNEYEIYNEFYWSLYLRKKLEKLL